MTKDQALKLALEALECLKRDFDADQFEWEIADVAITAIKQALAAPVQEPVAWLDKEKKIIYWHNTHEVDDYHGFNRTTPLYTTPPAARSCPPCNEDCDQGRNCPARKDK